MQQLTTQAGGMNYISHSNDGDEMSSQYESVFTDMAYQAFNSRFPEIAPQVTTFQVIGSDIDDGSASGAFLLEMNGDIFHVPVILLDNKIKPMDIMYSKKMDKFFPFTPEWMDTVEASALSEEGEAVNKKDMGLLNPNDVTDTLQPPMAAYRGGLGLSPTGTQMSPSGMNAVASSGTDLPSFTEFLKVANIETKEKFLSMLTKNEDLLKFAAANIEMPKLKESLAVNKEAGKTADDELRVIDTATPVEKIKETFKGDTVKVMEELATRGFTAKDSRKDLSVAYDVETPKNLESITTSGYYNIAKKDGSMVPALVMVEPQNLTAPDNCDDCISSPSPTFQGERANKKKLDYIVILEDGSYFKYRGNITANTVKLSKEQDTAFKKLLTAGTPKRKDPIMFIKKVGAEFKSIQPFYVDKVIMNKDNSITYTELDAYYYENNSNKSLHRSSIGEEKGCYDNTVVVLPSLKNGKAFYSTNGRTLFLDPTYTPFVLKPVISKDAFLLGDKEVFNHLFSGALAADAQQVKVASRGAGDYSINNIPSGDLRETTEKLARDYSIQFEQAYTKVASLRFLGDKAELLVVPFEKNASIFLGTEGSQVTPEMVQQNHQEMQQQQPMQQEMPANTQSYMDPALMQSGADMNNEELYNLGAIQSIVEDPKVMEMMQEYTPALEKAMDNTGRLLLTLWTEGSQHTEDLGEERFKKLENSARNAFKELGTLILLVAKHPKDLTQ